MASYMAKVYANLIRDGKKKIEEVPEKIRAEVEEFFKCLDCCSFYSEEGGGDYGQSFMQPLLLRERKPTHRYQKRSSHR